MSVQPCGTTVPGWSSEGASHSQRSADRLAYDGAMQMAVTIRDAWWRLGQFVLVWIESDQDDGRRTYVVRSDLVDGCARRASLRGEQPYPVILRSTAS